MYIHIDDEGISLRDPLDFTRFHVEILHSSGAKEADVILRRHGLGWAGDEKQAYIRVDALHTLNSAGDDEWHHALDRMAAGAREHGWWDPATASIAAHIATTPPADRIASGTIHRTNYGQHELIEDSAPVTGYPECTHPRTRP